MICWCNRVRVSCCCCQDTFMVVAITTSSRHHHTCVIPRPCETCLLIAVNIVSCSSTDSIQEMCVIIICVIFICRVNHVSCSYITKIHEHQQRHTLLTYHGLVMRWLITNMYAHQQTHHGLVMGHHLQHRLSSSSTLLFKQRGIWCMATTLLLTQRGLWGNITALMLGNMT